MYVCIYIYIYIIHTYSIIGLCILWYNTISFHIISYYIRSYRIKSPAPPPPRASPPARPRAGRALTISLTSQNFKSRVSNPIFKYIELCVEP